MPTQRRPARLFAVLGAIVVSFGTAALAQSAGNKRVAPQAVAGDDPDFARAVKEWTTRPEFGSPLVDHLPKAAGVPEPKDILGHHIGEPKIGRASCRERV